MLVDLPDKLYARDIDDWEYLFAEIIFIDRVDLGGEFQRDAGGARYSNRAVRALFRRNPPQKGKVAPCSNDGRCRSGGMPWCIVAT